MGLRRNDNAPWNEISVTRSFTATATKNLEHLPWGYPANLLGMLD